MIIHSTDAVNSKAFILVDEVDMTDGELTAVHGDSAPAISCYSSTVTLTYWDRRESPTLPTGVTDFRSSLGVPSQHLQWSRMLEFSDTGQYRCALPNSDDEFASTLDITVTRKEN